MTEWKEYKLGELIKTNVKSIGRDYPYSKILYLDTGSITCNNIDSFQEFELDKAPSRAKRLVKQDDIIYSSVRPNQLHYGYITNPQDNLVVSTGFVTITCNKELLCPKFLYYFLIQSQITEYLHSVAEASTSAYPSLKPSDIEALDIEIPPLDIQHRIASILSSLDGKIDLLHRENATLEQMAETMFRQWFVEESKEEWEEKPLGKCIKLIGGGTPKTSEERFWNGNVCWLSGGDIANNHKSFVSSSEKSISQDGLNNSSAKLLPENAMVVSARGTVGKYCLLSKPMAFSQSNYGILPIFEGCYFFTYLLVAYHIDELQSAAYGSVFDTITTKTFDGVSVLLPQKTSCIVEFEKMIEPYFSKMKYNKKQIRTLIQTRDGLLGKLMSGEIEI